jgi:hypothetical protein
MKTCLAALCARMILHDWRSTGRWGAASRRLRSASRQLLTLFVRIHQEHVTHEQARMVVLISRHGLRRIRQVNYPPIAFMFE